MTDRNFSTGIDTDGKRIPYARIAVRCPYRGLEHTLGLRDAPLGQSALLGKQIGAADAAACRATLKKGGKSWQ
jgi:hypothetical protein